MVGTTPDAHDVITARTRDEFNEFVADYGVAAEALLSGRPDAVSWFPEGSYIPAMVFVGDPAPPSPPPPPTREITELELAP